MKHIHLSLAHMSGKEEAFIHEAFLTNWVVPLGPNVDGFENDLATWLGKNLQIPSTWWRLVQERQPFIWRW